MDDDESDWRLKGVAVALLVVCGGMMIGPRLFPGQEMRRNVYASLEDCQRDYTQQQCQSSNGSGGVKWLDLFEQPIGFS